jgi:hypothetical protein
MWQGAVKACKANDATRTGFVPRHVFTQALGDNLSSTLDGGAIEELTNSYGIGDDVDYHSCFRSALNNVMGVGSSTSSKSKFELASTSKSRALGPTHPWDYDYQKHPSSKKDEGDPYWKRACTIPRDHKLGGSVKQSSGSMNNSTEFGDMDPKIISAAKKATANPQFKRFANELKRASITNHKGCISVNNFTLKYCLLMAIHS